MTQRRRRGNKPAGTPPAAGEKSPQPGTRPQAQTAVAKKTQPARPQVAGSPSPGRTGGGSRRSCKPSLSKRVGRILENFPVPHAQIPEFLKVLAVAKEAVEAGTFALLTQEEIFYLIVSGVETLVEETLDDVYGREFKNLLAAIRIEHGLNEHQYWHPGDPAIPEEYNRLLEEFRTRKRQILTDLYNELGFKWIAELVADNYSAYIERRDDGKKAFLGKTHPGLLTLPDVECESTLEEDEDEEEVDAE